MATIRSSMNAYLRDHLASAFAEPLPQFTCTLVLHQGHLSLGKLDGVTGGIEQIVPVGQDVQLLAKLLDAAQAFQWPALFSPAAVKHWTVKGLSQNYTAQREADLGEQTLRLYRAE
jgi:hypothetical protein